jgi:hypothetical protein
LVLVAVDRCLEYPARKLTVETGDKRLPDHADFEDSASDEFNPDVLPPFGNTR